MPRTPHPLITRITWHPGSPVPTPAEQVAAERARLMRERNVLVASLKPYAERLDSEALTIVNRTIAKIIKINRRLNINR